jgi:hypothetical protein
MLKHSGQAAFLDVVLPQFRGARLRPSVALLQRYGFVVCQWSQRAKRRGVNEAARILLEIETIHEQVLNAARHDNRSMRPQQANPAVAQGLGDGVTLRHAANVRRVGVHWYGVRETIGEIAYGEKRAVHHRKERGKRRVAVTDGPGVRAGSIHGNVQRRFHRRRRIAFQNIAVKINHENVVGGERQTASVARLNEHPVGARYAGAYVPAVIHDIGHDQQSRAGGNLLPEIICRCVGHRDLTFRDTRNQQLLRKPSLHRYERSFNCDVNS